MNIQFLGAAREVTGSKHLLTTPQGKKILLDCGMFQGKGQETESLNKHLGFNPAEIDHLILSHAHIDHSGLIPYIYKLGFRGSVVCTNATRDLCAIMLADAGFIQEQDTYYFNKKRERQGLEPVEPLFTKADAQACMELFIGVPYDRKFRIDEHIRVKFTQSGHMLGSAVVSLGIMEDGKERQIAYTGDIGRPSNRILAHPRPFPQAEVLITESTYGDRLHQDKKETEDTLLQIVEETCVKKGGKLIIPSFSVGRTQEIVYALNNFYNERRLPKIDIYVDSPLAVNATEVFRMHPECFNEEVHEVMETDPDPFGFNSLFYIRSREESRRLNDLTKPCVIIAASGMMEAGRVKHHLANTLSDPRNTVLAVGYCAPRTLGARLLNGEKEVSIHGWVHEVRADIKRLESFSGHGDYKEMIGYLSCQDQKALQQVILVHGEYETQAAYKKHLEEAGYSHISIPEAGESMEI